MDGPPRVMARRTFVLMAAGSALGLGQALRSGPLMAEPAAEQGPTAADRLVVIEDPQGHAPLRPGDVPENGKPVLALPYDRTSGSVRDGSRLNRILLLRLPPDSLDTDTRARAADGVLAFSAVCTHEGCPITEWVAAEQSLLCFCHFSKFDPRASGSVVSGPASRSLPALPLGLENGELVVNGPFSATPGVKRQA